MRRVGGNVGIRDRLQYSRGGLIVLLFSSAIALCVSVAGAAEYEIEEWWRLRYADGTELAASEVPEPEIRHDGTAEFRRYRATDGLELQLRIETSEDGTLRCGPILLDAPKAVEYLGAPYAVRFPVKETESVFVAASSGLELRSAFFRAVNPGAAPWRCVGNVEPAAPESLKRGVIALSADSADRFEALRNRLAEVPELRRVGQLTDFLAVEGICKRHNQLAGFIQNSFPGVEVIPLRSWDDFVRGAAECDVIVNCLAGGVPARSEKEAAAGFELIGEFLRRGGRWIEVFEADPFTQLFVPDLRLPEFHFAYPNRGEGTADFTAFGNAETGVVALYGVQERNAPVFDPSLPRDRYVCGTESTVVSLGDGTARWTHEFHSHAPAGRQAFHFPATVIAPYRTLRAAMIDYGKRNRIGKTLSEKVEPELLDRWRRALLLKINDKRMPVAEWRKLVESHPFDSPILYHHIEWVHDGGVFDQYYPDYFPYDPEIGSEEELRKFYHAVHDGGDLAMPYTQPVFWDLAPERMDRRFLSERVMRETGSYSDVQTFLRALTTRDTAGNPYGIGNVLTHVSPWHPAVREINRRNYRKFVDELGASIYFHDSIGAEPYRNDYSAHLPAPNAHLHGLLALAETERGYGSVPLVTDEGFDLLCDSYSMLCGMNFLTMPSSWGIYRPYRERYAKGSCRLFPFLGYLLHDKVLLSGHNSGTSIFHRGGVSLYAVCGLSLQNSVRLPDLLADLKQPDGGWLRTLAALQNELGALTGGEVLLSVRYPAEDVLETAWGGGGRVVANLRPEPFRGIAPYGFLAERNGEPVAGIVIGEDGTTKWFAGENELTPPAMNAGYERLE